MAFRKHMGRRERVRLKLHAVSHQRIVERLRFADLPRDGDGGVQVEGCHVDAVPPESFFTKHVHNEWRVCNEMDVTLKVRTVVVQVLADPHHNVQVFNHFDRVPVSGTPLCGCLTEHVSTRALLFS